MDTTCPYSPYPRAPITGVTPWAGQNISGAQNLSGLLPFNPGHWALGLQKLPLVRFHFRAWICRANAPGPFPGVRATLAVARKPSPLGEGGTRSVTGEVRGQRPPAGRSGTGPYGVHRTDRCSFSVGAGPRPARRCFEPNLSPTTPKGALSTDRSNPQRLPDNSAAAVIEGQPVS